MILYLIRHGESAHNAAGRIQGQADPPLSALGERQAAALAGALKDRPIEAVYASPLRRAWDTARPLAEKLNLDVRPLDGLMELHAGVFQGLTWEEVRRDHAEAAERWAGPDADYRIPGGETRRELMTRGRAALEAIRSGGHGEAAVVAHGGILAAALKSLLGIPAELNPFSFYNASISKLAWGGTVKLLTLNEIPHLRNASGEHDTRSGDL